MAKVEELNFRVSIVEDGSFGVGDVVRLRSGGPAMTVTYHNDESGYSGVKYFDGLEFRDAQFKDSMLVGCAPD